MSAESGATTPLQIYAERFPSLTFTQPEAGVLEIIISNPKHLNAADARMHRDLASVWREIDLDDSVRAVLVRGDGDHFSSGGDFSLIEAMFSDEATLIRVWSVNAESVRHLAPIKYLLGLPRRMPTAPNVALPLHPNNSILARCVRSELRMEAVLFDCRSVLSLSYAQ
jgi:hypothetical protein